MASESKKKGLSWLNGVLSHQSQFENNREEEQGNGTENTAEEVSHPVGESEQPASNG